MKKVYLIRAAQFYKIGQSVNPEKRLKSIQTGCPIRCSYLGCIPTPRHIDADHFEKVLHSEFAVCRTYGEWFELSEDHIKSLIVDYGFKPLENPYPSDRTEESDKPSEEIAKAREFVSDLKSLEAIYSTLSDGCGVSDYGRNTLSKLLRSFGSHVSHEAIREAFTKFDKDKGWKYLTNIAKSYKKYGRHVSDNAWQVFYAVNKYNKTWEAKKVLDIVMRHNIDRRINVEWVKEYAQDNCVDDIIDEIEYHFLTPNG